MIGKRRKKSLFLYLFLVFLFILLTGCKKNPNGVQVIEYELKMDSAAQQEGSKSYKGIMGIPEGNNCPVVFLLHGAHSVEGEQQNTPYYKGFEYLVKELANNGYLAVSFDINNAYTGDSKEGSEYTRIKNAFQFNYDQLVQANNGKNIFVYDIKGKADLEKINMIGHSRGGENITRIIADSDFKKISFASALKIASPENCRLQENYVDIPTALIYSQYDEDVAGIESADYYYYAYNNDLARRTPILSAFLYGGNHAAYNTLVNQGGMFNYGDEVTYLDPETQREFTKKYAIDFLNVYNKNEDFFQVFNNETAKDYGIDFMLSVHEPSGTRIIMPNEYMREISAKDMDLEYVVSSSNEWKDTAKAFNPPGGSDYLPLYKLSWEKTGGSVSIPFDGLFFELTKEKILSFYMALDSSDPKNKPDSTVSFHLLITDAEGNDVTIPFSSETYSALKYQPGKLVKEDGTNEKWNAFTPLGSVLIKLDQLDDKIIVDNIVSLTILPTSETGAVMLGGLNVYGTNGEE